jgi:transcriptional regulator with XRE-family HTH domain
MKQNKLTGTELAKRLGVSRVTLYRLKRQYPTEAPKSFNDVEKWRSFCLAHVTGSDQITRLGR